MKARSVLANLSFAITVAIAAFQTASQFDKRAPRNRNDGTQRSMPAPESYSSTGITVANRLRQTFARIRSDRIVPLAAGITFYGLLALFPAIAAIISIYGLIAGSQYLYEILAFVEGALPSSGARFLRNRIERVGTEHGATLSFALVISVITAMWSANRGMKALFEGLNVAYGEIETRSFIRLNILTMFFTIGLLCFLIIAVFIVADIPSILEEKSSSSPMFILFRIVRWPFLFILSLLSVEILYRMGPCRNGYQRKWVSPGAMLAVLSWMIGTFLFSAFLSNFQNYDMTFGTLAAVDGLLVWMWLSSITILMGAELNGVGVRQSQHMIVTARPQAH
jgi:membrane protein